MDDTTRKALTYQIMHLENQAVRFGQLSSDARMTAAELQHLLDTTPEPPDPPDPFRTLVYGPHDDSLTDGLDVAAMFDRDAGDNTRQPQSAGIAPLFMPEPGVIRAKLYAKDQTPKHGGATGSHELHLPFNPTSRIRFSVDVRFPNLPDLPFDPGQTGKIHGVTVWDGNWGHWPGGNNTAGVDTCSFRFIHNFYNRRDWRFGAYLYLGGGRVTDVETVHGSPLNYASNGDQTGEWLFKDGPFPGMDEWFTLSADLDLVEGTADVYVNGEQVLLLMNIPWVESEGLGWNHGYPDLIFGGPPSFAPQNAARGSAVDYRNYRIEAL